MVARIRPLATAVAIAALWLLPEAGAITQPNQDDGTASQDAPRRVPASPPGRIRFDTLPETIDMGPAMTLPDGLSSGTPGLPLMRRLVRLHHFEERTAAPYDFPPGYFRVAPDPERVQQIPSIIEQQHRPGFPLFGSMRYCDEQARDGAWSFRFDLQGGSMAAAMVPGVLPIIPGGDYLITGWIRTDRLEHARAGLAAYFFDQDGRPITESIVESSFVQTAGIWTEVSIVLPGNHLEAVDLGLEMQVLQPNERHDRQHREANAHRPNFQDVEGSVWFDEIAIWHLPRIELRTTAPGNLATAGERPQLVLRINDLASDAVAAHLRIMDIHDEIVREETFRIERGAMQWRFDLDNLPHGWYRATLALSSSLSQTQMRMLQREIQFTLDDGGPFAPRGRRRFGVNLDHEQFADVLNSVQTLDRLAATLVNLPTWSGTLVPEVAETQYRELRPLVDGLLNTGTDVMFTLASLPDQLAREVQLDTHQVASIFLQNDGAWQDFLQPYLEPLLVTFGQRVQRWQVGATSTSAPGDPTAMNNRRSDELVRTATETLGRLVPGPRIVLPRAVDDPAAMQSSRAEQHVHVPYHIPPESIPDFLASHSSGGDRLMLTIQPLPRESYRPRDRAIDVAMRGLNATRTSVRWMLLETPWHWLGEIRRTSQPEPTLVAWRQVARNIGDRTFAGEVPIKRGLRCWLFDGDEGAVLVVWNETARPADATLDVQLADASVRVLDLMGNERIVSPVDGLHEIAVDDMPQFIHDVDPILARFRQQFAITPDLIPARQRESEHTVRIHNPWSVGVTGSLRLLVPEDWRVSPRRMNFVIPAGESVELPVAIQIGRTETAGPKRIEADVAVMANRAYSFRVTADAEVGLDTLHVSPSWRLTADEAGELRHVLVTQSITNLGDAPVTLETVMLAPGYSRERRFLPRLNPGETEVRAFLLEDGATRLVGESIFLSVSEVDGTARLNHRLDLPSGAQRPMLAGERSTGDADTPR